MAYYNRPKIRRGDTSPRPGTGLVRPGQQIVHPDDLGGNEINYFYIACTPPSGPEGWTECDHSGTTVNCPMKCKGNTYIYTGGQVMVIVG